MLRLCSILAGCVLAGLLATGSAARAQTLPPGPYLQSCRDLVMQGAVLVGTCQRPDGGWRVSTLNLPGRCPGVIDNVGGWLKCLPGPAFGSSVSGPPPQSPAAGR